MGVESGARRESTWARAARLEAALWVVGLFWSAVVVAMAVLTPVRSFTLLVLAPVTAAAAFSLCLRVHDACVRHRRGRP
jgi:hypothetical protein